MKVVILDDLTNSHAITKVQGVKLTRLYERVARLTGGCEVKIFVLPEQIDELIKELRPSRVSNGPSPSPA